MTPPAPGANQRLTLGVGGAQLGGVAHSAQVIWPAPTLG